MQKVITKNKLDTDIVKVVEPLSIKTIGEIISEMKTISLLLSLAFFSASLFAQSESRLESHFFFSPSLGISKSYYVYLPADYDGSSAHYPVVYFLRLHEYEWFNPNLPGRGRP